MILFIDDFVSDAGFNYSAFLSGKSGDVWLANGTHYTDTGRTTVASVNDTIASLSGEGAQFNAAQAISGSRPTLRESSAKRYIEFDGGDDMSAGSSGNWDYLHNTAGNGYMCIAVQVGSSSNPDAIYAIACTNGFGTGQIGIATAYEDRVAAGVNDAFRSLISRGVTGSPAIENVGQNNVFPAQTDVILEVVKSGSSFEQFVNGVSVFSGTMSGSSDSNSTNALFIGSAAGSFRMIGRIYGMMVVNSVPGTSDRAAIQADMSARCITPPI